MSENKIVALVGIPGSGKSTYARKLCSENPIYRRINNDDLGAMSCLTVQEVSAHLERYSLSSRIAAFYVELGLVPVLDNTNTHPNVPTAIYTLAEQFQATVEWHILYTSFPLCVRRNDARTTPIPDEVMEGIYKQFIIAEKFLRDTKANIVEVK